MRMFRVWAKPMSIGAVLVFIGFQFSASAARASLIGTEQILQRPAPSANDPDRERIRRFLAREDVRAHMVALGVDPEEAKKRVDSLSDREVAQIGGRLDELPAGQDSVGVVVGAILIVFLVLLLTDLLGLTRVFPFVRPPKGAR